MWQPWKRFAKKLGGASQIKMSRALSFGSLIVKSSKVEGHLSKAESMCQNPNFLDALDNQIYRLSMGFRRCLDLTMRSAPTNEPGGHSRRRVPDSEAEH